VAPPGVQGQIKVTGFVGNSALLTFGGEKRETNRITTIIAKKVFILLFMIELLSVEDSTPH
jgi:hypothetical protein